MILHDESHTEDKQEAKDHPLDAIVVSFFLVHLPSTVLAAATAAAEATADNWEYDAEQSTKGKADDKAHQVTR